MKRFVTAIALAIPTAASAHPGHEHFGVTNHSFGEWTMLGLVAASGIFAAMWLRRQSR